MLLIIVIQTKMENWISCANEPTVPRCKSSCNCNQNRSSANNSKTKIFSPITWSQQTKMHISTTCKYSTSVQRFIKKLSGGSQLHLDILKFNRTTDPFRWTDGTCRYVGQVSFFWIRSWKKLRILILVYIHLLWYKWSHSYHWFF